MSDHCDACPFAGCADDRDQLAKVLGVAKVDAVAEDEQSLFDLLAEETA